MSMISRHKRLNPEALDLIQKSMKAGGKAYYDVTLQEARQLSDNRAKELAGEFDFDGTTENIHIPSKNVTGGTPAIVYRPNKTKIDPPVVVFFHGGGMVVGSAAARIVSCQMLAQICGCIIVNVEYRLAPEHKFPCIMEDGKEAVEWTITNKTQLGGTAKSLIGVSGDSAGGTISASICHDVKGIDFQILIYPRTVHVKSLPSYKAFEEHVGLNDKLIDWFGDLTYKNESDAQDPRMMACYRERFDHVPPALFIVAECDPIRDDSYVYASKLITAGVPADIVTIKGAMHGFFHIPGACNNSCAEAYEAFERFLTRMHQEE